MKIIHTATGKAFQLKPNAQLEVERTNLFFNEWGEQTLPIELPDTDRNRLLTGFPDMGVNKAKALKNIDCSITEGDYFMHCRMAVLKAKRKETISTSFYMNEGSFLSKVGNISLKQLFDKETVPGVSTVAQGIAFCKQLLAGTHENYACFPVLIDFESERRYVNRVEWMNSSGNHVYSGRLPEGQNPPSGYTMGFYNEFDRVEKNGETSILLSPGYYITPFIRARYLLRRIFQYFGYTLAPGFFDTTDPFKNMVFVNNTMDSLVNGTILLAHLVPDCMCSVILDVFRKKFNCEFVPDEVSKVVTIKFFNEIINEKTVTDLSNCRTAPLENDYSQKWKRIKLSSESVKDDGSSFDSIADMIAKYPEAYLNDTDGAYYHTGFSTHSWAEKIAGSTIPYSAGGTLDEQEITVPDCAISMQNEPEYSSGIVVSGQTSTGSRWRPYAQMPYIGEANALNSTIVLKSSSSKDSDSEGTSASEVHTQDPILCFVYKNNLDNGFTYGTTTQCNVSGTKIWDYSLHYYGQYGIFEKFYRTLDNLYRNSLIPVRASLLLTTMQKQHIPAHDKIIIDGQEFLINKLKYTLGGKNEPAESELLTVQLYEPVTSAPIEADRFPVPAYKWIPEYTRRTISESEYDVLLIKNNSLPAIYPPPPTEAQYTAGGKYYTRIYYEKVSSGYLESTVYLIPKLYDYTPSGGR
nr:MAG TPA: hypothetical protein [Caudoviricetes sp.]